MPLPAPLLPSTALHERRTDVLAGPLTVPGSAAISVSFQIPVRVVFVGSSLGAGVTCDITGTLSGSPQTESILLPNAAPSKIRSTKSWSTITNLGFPTATTGTVTASAQTEEGQPAYRMATIATAQRGRLRHSRVPVVEAGKTGATILERLYWYTNAANLQAEDRLTVSGVSYRVEGVENVFGYGGKHHVRAFLERL